MPSFCGTQWPWPAPRGASVLNGPQGASPPVEEALLGTNGPQAFLGHVSRPEGTFFKKHTGSAFWGGPGGGSPPGEEQAGRVRGGGRPPGKASP
eukprot:5868593-Alexandrium_andersonii.AAC.1